jgi:hypothetical protein
MNKSELKLLIEESVESKLKTLIPKILDEYFSGKITTTKEPDARKKPTVQESVPATPKEKKTYVKNPLINDILNETVVKLRPEAGVSPVSSGMSPAGSSSSVLDKIEELPPKVADVLTRDYSQLLKLSKTKSAKK